MLNYHNIILLNFTFVHDDSQSSEQFCWSANRRRDKIQIEPANLQNGIIIKTINTTVTQQYKNNIFKKLSNG